jgi:hypothetical protein
MKDKSSILMSIFRRKGAEGQFTKIIGESNSPRYNGLLSSLEEDERGLLIYYKNESDWLLLTNKKIITSSNDVIFNSDIIEVSPALQEEYRSLIINKKEFTKLYVKDRYNKSYILNFEMGNPYEGFYQLLHFIAANNRHT